MPKVQTIKASNMLKKAMHAIRSRKKIHLSDGSMTFKYVPGEEQYDSETMEMSYQLAIIQIYPLRCERLFLIVYHYQNQYNLLYFQCIKRSILKF